MPRIDIYIYVYAFSRRIYPKRLTIAFRLYNFISMCVPWESNPQPFALLTQCSTTEPHRNSLRKPATGLTPFQSVLGFQPPLFPWSGEPSDLPAVNSWLQQSERTWNEAHVHLQWAVRRTKEQADRRRRPDPNYQPGQWVWLSIRDQRL